MPVSGVVVSCEADGVGAVRERIEGRPRLEIREQTERHLIVVTDTESVEQDRAEVAWIDRLPGVLSTQVAFTNIEDVVEAAADGDVSDRRLARENEDD